VGRQKILKTCRICLGDVFSKRVGQQYLSYYSGLWPSKGPWYINRYIKILQFYEVGAGNN
jgi:hypothetical protein